MTHTTAEQPSPAGAIVDRSIPSLDGLRAISIALVLVSHLSGTRGLSSDLAWTSIFDLGNLGVRVFFVISGYLITGLLMRERGRTGTVHLGRFYLRRTLRIFPAYYAYVGVIAAFVLLGRVVLQPTDLAHVLTYTQNYNVPPNAWLVGHAWSLSVEEQFYLLWPAVFGAAGIRKGIWIALAFAIVAPVWRLLGNMHPPAWYPLTGYNFEMMGDALAIGCLLAMVRERLWSNTVYRRLLESRWFWLVPVVVAVLATKEDGRFQWLIGNSLTNVCLAMCIDWCVRFHQGRIGRVLNWRPLAFMGVLSYSLYLWQQPFLNRAGTAWMSGYPQNVALLALAALASYYAVERPFLRLRQRIEAKWWPR
jgi:peptidoglycan/LPS O-acetylase OafA/YrhL